MKQIHSRFVLLLLFIFVKIDTLHSVHHKNPAFSLYFQHLKLFL